MSVPTAFSYGDILEEVRTDVRAATERIAVRVSRTAEDIVVIGRDFIFGKESLGYGHFLRSIKAAEAA